MSALELRAPTSAEPVAAGTSYVTVRVDQQLFGLPIDRVHDVFWLPELTRVPLAPPEVAGLLNLRGRVVTAIDLRRRLGLDAAAAPARRMAVGIDEDGDSYGLVVDAVGEVMHLPAGGRDDLPVHLDPRWAAIAAGIHRLAGELLVILDVAAVLDISRSAATPHGPNP